jgi:C-terminal processing protease CtpA/Prc
VKVKREKIEVPSVTYEVKVLTGNIRVGYINISII